MPSRNPPTPFLEALKRVAAALRAADVPFALAGSMAVWASGGPPSSHDVDMVICEADHERALEALDEAGLRTERPPEGWLVKAWDGEVLIDLIWGPAGIEINRELLAATVEVRVDGMDLPVLAPTEILVSKLTALTESHLDFEGLLAMVRGVREQIDWAEVQARTEELPLARSFLHMVDELGLTGEKVLART